MEFRARLTLRTDLEAAVHDLCVDLRDFEPDLAMLFASHHYGPEFVPLVERVYSQLNARNLIGCTGESIIGPTAEIESRPAIVLWAARLPDVRVLPFVMDQQDLESIAENDDKNALYDRLGVRPEDDASFVILPEPFSISPDAFLQVMDEAFPGATIVGGMASGATAPTQNRLFLNDQSLRQGMVGVSLSAAVEITSILSQGCRPIGEPLVITKATDNFIEELGGRPAFNVLQDLYNHAGSTDQMLMRRGLHVGRLIDETRRTFGAGDFLVRNMMGVTEDRSLAVADFIRPGQTIQFHVRDSTTARDEMERLLREEHDSATRPPAGALLFNCNGRGRRFFERPNHDISLVNEFIRGCETAGFFAQGEIGPVGGKHFVHGYTSSLILFREPAQTPA